MPTDAKLDICLDVLNEAMQCNDPNLSRKILDQMEIMGYKEEAENLRKIMGGGLNSPRTHHMSKFERRQQRKNMLRSH